MEEGGSGDLACVCQIFDLALFLSHRNMELREGWLNQPESASESLQGVSQQLIVFSTNTSENSSVSALDKLQNQFPRRLNHEMTQELAHNTYCLKIGRGTNLYETLFSLWFSKREGQFPTTFFSNIKIQLEADLEVQSRAAWHSLG